ncbi:uncharacterized protein LOC136036344 [Artemia franciscana]|uniref:Uncharacterized protein n=1 Tax=Artemia franciscana TaxID=6661 RepID=A0AA88LCT8_ARTSF|nr:hypothetical protein QYM36_004554 [Artemia franciscana]
MKSNVGLIFCAIVLSSVLTDAIPLRRSKRVSDQRLAELETLLALAKLRGRYVTLPVGLGMINPAKIGKRKRSVSRIPVDTEAVDERHISIDKSLSEESSESEEIRRDTRSLIILSTLLKKRRLYNE